MADKYNNFEDLARYEKEGLDFDIELKDRSSVYAVIAIHGGNIEPATTEIGCNLAGDDFSFYSFIGKKKTEQESEDLHITSSHFDEPRVLALVQRSPRVISIHGKSGRNEFIMVGGLDGEMVQKTKDVLMANNFVLFEAPDKVNGDSLGNICNKSISKKGLQLEISRGLRDEFLKSRKKLLDFCHIIKGIL